MKDKDTVDVTKSNIPTILNLLEKERLSSFLEIDEKFIPQLLYEIEVLKRRISNTINRFC